MKTKLKTNAHHGGENNAESQKLYNNNLEHFNNQCRMVLEQFLTGRELTSMSAMKLGIGHLPRRAKDLKDLHNIPVQDERVKGSRCKKWFLKKKFINEFLAEPVEQTT